MLFAAVLLKCVLKGKDGDSSQDGCDDRKHSDDPHLRPASHLKMMVNGRHSEEPFPSGMPEPEHLNDHGDDFKGINKSHDRDEKRELEHICHSGDKASQRQ